MAVQTKKGHAVSGFHTCLAQSAGEAGRAVRKLRVRESVVTTNDCCPVGILLLGITQTTKWCERNVHGSKSGSGRLSSVNDEHVARDVIRSVGSKKHCGAF